MSNVEVGATSLKATGIERRRPGRLSISNPYLIALLRHAGELSRTHHTAKSMLQAESIYDEQKVWAEDASIGDTISLIDGACQLGTPHNPAFNIGSSLVGAPDCFLDNQVHYVADVLLATIRGAVPVQQIRIGDVVLTHSGKRRVAQIDRFDFTPSGRAEVEQRMPVLVQQGALGAELPGRDLIVSPTHCLWIAGRVIPAWLLTNSLSIWQLSGKQRTSYIRVVYDRPAHGQLVSTASQAAPFWRRVVARAEVGPSVQLLAGGRLISPIGMQNDRRTFIVPPGTQAVHLVSFSALAVSRIEVDTSGNRQITPADHPDLRSGWDGVQHHGSAPWRTMQRVAELPVQTQDMPARLTVYLRRAGDH
ncbi:MAG: Hint domain-containing protein [Rhodopila sp.]